MNLFLRLSSFFKPTKSLEISESPLQFSEVAIQQIKSHIENRPANVKSAFKVAVLYKKESYNCQVGYDDYKQIRKSLYKYPIPLIISEQDELFLKGCYIDYHEDEKSFFHYPNVHLEVSDRSNESIFVFHIDRYIISKDSPIQEYALEKNQSNESLPIILQQLVNSNLIESIYLKENLLSIEKIKTVKKEIFEAQITNIILSYFEKCGYSLYITETEIKEKKFEN